MVKACGMSSRSVMVVLILGFAAILVSAMAQVAVAPEAAKYSASINVVNNSEDERYVPYAGERFDVFDWALCKKLSRGYSGNMLISPISIKLALVLLYEGAQGQTAYELASALQLPADSSAIRDRYSSILRSLQTVRAEYTLDISTRLIFDTSINPTQRYSSIVKTFYSADVVVANLTDAHVAIKNINDWVSNVTHGHVKDILTDEQKLKDSIFLVINALYFMGTWRYPFSPRSTIRGNFLTGVEKSVEVPYMNTVGEFYYTYSPELDSQVLRLPYLGDKYAMFIVLPRAITGLDQLIDRMNPIILRQNIQKMTEVELDVAIPKFKFEFTSHLENVLRGLGIQSIFDDSASLIGIARAKQMGQRPRVTDFMQKAGLEVDEAGTTAQAVTVVLVGTRISKPRFIAKHPFLFFIEDETTGTILFMGKVTNPLETSGGV